MGLYNFLSLLFKPNFHFFNFLLVPQPVFFHFLLDFVEFKANLKLTGSQIRVDLLLQLQIPDILISLIQLFDQQPLRFVWNVAALEVLIDFCPLKEHVIVFVIFGCIFSIFDLNRLFWLIYLLELDNIIRDLKWPFHGLKGIQPKCKYAILFL